MTDPVKKYGVKLANALSDLDSIVAAVKAVGSTDTETREDLAHWVICANEALRTGLSPDPADSIAKSGPINGGKWAGNTYVNDAGEPMGTCRGY